MIFHRETENEIDDWLVWLITTFDIIPQPLRQPNYFHSIAEWLKQDSTFIQFEKYFSFTSYNFLELKPDCVCEHILSSVSEVNSVEF